MSMKTRYRASNGISGDELKQRFEQHTPYSKDLIVAGDPLNPGAFLLDAKITGALLASASGGSAYSTYGVKGACDRPSPTIGATDEPISESDASLGTAVNLQPSEPATASPGYDSAVNGPTSITATSSGVEAGADGLQADPLVVTARSILQDAVGGGPSVATSLETAYEVPGRLSGDGTQASLLAVNDPERQARVQREKLAGSPRADRIVGGPGKNEIDGREGNDELVGGASDDVFIGGAGDDVLDGGLGNDVARYRGSVLEYDISRISSTQVRVRHARFRPGQNDGNDLARNVKRLDFKDRQVFLDGSNNAPLAQPDEGLSVVDGRSLTIPFARLLGNDVDFDGDRLSITQVKGKPANSVRIVGNSVVFTPPAGIQWALADFASYETTFLYTVSDGKGGTATASASVTINRPSDLRGLRTGPADISQDGAGGPGDAPGQVYTKASGLPVTGTDSGDLILVPSSAAMTGGTVDGAGGVDELRFTNTGTAQTLTLGSTLTNVEQVVIGTGTTSTADTSGTTANNVNASGVGYGLLMTGNAGANTLTGTAFGDQIDGGVGADRMVGGAGSDTYFVDNTGDIVTESSSTGGTDTVWASVNFTLGSNVENLVLSGIDNVNGTGNSLANTLTGNTGNNTLNGGTGNDTMSGGLGDDTYVVNVATDVVTELADQGIDTVNAGASYTLAANVENLLLTGTGNISGTGNTLNNTLTGNSGNNTLNGGLGDDTLIGGAGNDTYVVDSAADVVTEAAGAGTTDTVQASVSFTLGANVERLTLTGTGNIDGTGNDLANTLTGNAGNNVLDGGTGVDTMTGGAGNDTYVVDSTTDVVTESSGGGTDTVQASTTFTLGSNVENLVLTGTGNINGTGNTLANTLTGNAGNNALSGGTGADTMLGGAGDDSYTVDNTGDVVTENSGEGTDTVNASVTYTLGANVENLVLTGTSGLTGTGNALNNTLTGNSAANTLNGGDGDDILEGAAGNDTLDGGAGTADIARYSGVQADYTVTPGTGGSFIVASTANGSDTVRNIEFLQFSGVTVPLGGSNQPPVAVADTATTAEDVSLTWPSTPPSTLLANDSDPDGGSLAITAVSGATNGTVGLTAGVVTFTPASNYNGSAGFNYTLSDGQGGTAAGNVSVTVTAVNDAPVANNDSGSDLSTPLNTPLTIAATRLLANDTDVEGSPLNVTGVAGATNGTVAPSGSNYIFTPTTGFTGTASFTYTASDGQTPSNAATVSITVGTPVSNAIVLENAKPGNPQSEWDVTNYDTRIEGYAAQFSVNKGEDVQFKVESDAAYQIDIYRLGYYGGDGARKVATIGSLPSSSQPNPVTDASTGLVDAGNWTVSATWDMPADAVSGVYIAKLVRNGGGANHIPFVVRDDNGNSDVLFQTADTTWQAYNDWGGNSLYSGSPAGRAYKVSYNRPINTRFASAPGQPADFLFDSEYPTIRFLEANGYDVSYFSGIDSDRRGAEIQEHDIFLSVGHDEYWSGQQRTNVEAARAAGVDLAFFSGNEVFWKTRWENSIDGSNTPYTTLVSYKETAPTGIDDPSSQATGTWRDPRFESDAGRPENALTGQIFTVNDGSAPPTAITVPAEDGQLRFWRNTGLGSTATQLASDILSYEWDEDLDNGSRPAGSIRLSSTTDPSTSYLQDFGSTYGTGSATHSLTMYRAPSGALVFGAGTPRWGWGLDAVHDGSSAIDSRIRQATVNLFADMGVQPSTLISGLTPATASTDTTRPTSTITSPTGGSTLQPGTPVTITGTASDVAGRVGGVEVSTDGGTTWRRAEGRSNWTYSWTPTVNGSNNIRSRAADDSLNLETPGAGINVTVGSGGGGSGTFSLWSASTTPAIVTDPDSAPIEVGVKFVPGQAGQITGIRFYKGPQNLGTHVGNLWNATGTQLLGTANFTNETASGWQQVNFANPVTVTAGTTYVASYFAPQGKYSVNENYFNSAFTNGPLTALATGTSGGNGVYRYTGTSAFPNSTFAASNYWVDVVFQTGPVNQPPVANPDARSTSEDTALTLPVTDLTANDTDPENNSLSITAVGGASNGAVVLNAGNVVFTPTANYSGAAAFTYTLSDGNSTATGTVNVTVNPVNDTPVANNDSGFTTPFQTFLNIPTSTLLGNDTDADNDTLTVDSVGGAVNGTVTPPGQTGNVVFTPNTGYSGPASFTYTIKDPSNAQATATVNLTVGASGNQPPNAVADSATTNEDSPVTISVLANDTDPDGHPLTVTLLNLTGTQGNATINANNTITYNPGAAFQSLDAGQQGTDTFSYEVSDGQGGISSAAVAVTVTGVDDAGPNRIVAENQLPGTPQSVWGINGPTTAIEGFATDISVDQGQRIDFKVNTVASDYRIDIYRMGYYQGNGARYITSIDPTSIITQQPGPLRDTATGLADAGNWSVSASWNVPTDAVSGVYIAKLVGEAGTSAENHMYFVVRDDDGRSDMMFQTSDSTWQAYNLWGGEDFYTGTPSSPTQAKKVSYNRPFGNATNSVNVPLMDAEYPMIRWMEANGYNVSYTTDVDTARRGQELLEHKAFLSVGHDEYWSNEQRANVEAARDAGVDLAFFSGNEMYWKTRWENSIDASGTPYPDARHLQGDLVERQGRSESAMDRNVARPAL